MTTLKQISIFSLWVLKSNTSACWHFCIKRAWNIYLLLYKSQGLAVWVWFDAASVVGGCSVEDPHQALQRVLESNNTTMDVMTWYSMRKTLRMSPQTLNFDTTVTLLRPLEFEFSVPLPVKIWCSSGLSDFWRRLVSSRGTGSCKSKIHRWTFADK